MQRKTRRVWAAIIMSLVGLAVGFGAVGTEKVSAESGCPQVRLVFARGSGGTRWEDQNYVTWRDAIDSKIRGMGVSYEFIDLNYPAVGVGVNDLDTVLTTVMAFVGTGDAYEFGKSVDAGAKNLQAMVAGDCPGTKYVFGGYSQGAMVVSKAVHGIDAERVIYAATFGDPKLYLPEGRAWGSGSLLNLLGMTGKNFYKSGTIPEACRGRNLSDYRAYVPDCYAYEGLLGAYKPYAPEGYVGKLGTWCNRKDVFCSSYLSVSNHLEYVSGGLYEDASRTVADKIAAEFGVDNTYVAPHDTVIMIDSTGSMRKMIDKYKAEALRLARETLDNGGRVALYSYGDYGDNHETPVKHCDFDECTEELVARILEGIEAGNYGNNNDWPESALSASMVAMKELDWKWGATKSMVILTDASYLAPDRDGTTFDEVVKMSKKIDPVNFYAVTNSDAARYWKSLTEETGGAVAILGVDEVELTDRIMTRHDSLPVVEEDEEFESLTGLPVLEVVEVSEGEEGAVKIRVNSTGTRVMVGLGEAILGVSEGEEVVISGLDRTVENEVVLVPLTSERRGFGERVTIGMRIPKAPNTGRPQ